VRFRPTGTGPRAGLLSFWVNTNAARINTTLTGTGQAEPEPALTPAGVDFGSLQIGETSAPAAVTLTNTGAGTLTFWRFGIASSSINAADFSVLAGGTCTLTLTLASGESCTTLVRFRPTGTGPRAGLLSFWVNTNAARINTTLTGSVVDECADGCF
jgi:hypothetical protein